MNKIIASILILLGCAAASAQESKYTKVDYDAIKREITDSSGAFYYPALMKRYRQNDTTLSLEQYRRLYYGYTFQEQYNPYWHFDQADILKEIYSKESLSDTDCDTLIKYASLALEENPFDLRDMKMLGYAYHVKGNDSLGVPLYLKKIGLTDAILSTGDGRTCKSGFTVIMVADEYELLQSFNLRCAGQSLTDDGCDCLKVEDASQHSDVMYFDVNRMLQAEDDLLKK